MESRKKQLVEPHLFGTFSTLIVPPSTEIGWDGVCGRFESTALRRLFRDVAPRKSAEIHSPMRWRRVRCCSSSGQTFVSPTIRTNLGIRLLRVELQEQDV